MYFFPLVPVLDYAKSDKKRLKVAEIEDLVSYIYGLMTGSCYVYFGLKATIFRQLSDRFPQSMIHRSAYVFHLQSYRYGQSD